MKASSNQSLSADQKSKLLDQFKAIVDAGELRPKSKPEKKP
jgi:hypothetical protein